MKYLSLIILSLFSLHGFAAPTGRIFVTNENGNTVSVIDGKTHQVEATSKSASVPRDRTVAGRERTLCGRQR
jgi:40-residue YVTN family beta-propeller repeat